MRNVRDAYLKVQDITDEDWIKANSLVVLGCFFQSSKPRTRAVPCASPQSPYAAATDPRCLVIIHGDSVTPLVEELPLRVPFAVEHLTEMLHSVDGLTDCKFCRSGRVEWLRNM